jgi:hypothetical protein
VARRIPQRSQNHPALRQGPNPEAAARISILLSPRVSPAEVLKIYRSFSTLKRQAKTGFGMILQGEATPTQLAALAESSAVLWIEPAPKPKLLDEIASKIVSGESPEGAADQHATAVQQLGFDGTGVVVAVADSGLNQRDAATMHPDLAGRWMRFFSMELDRCRVNTAMEPMSRVLSGDGATGETDEGPEGAVR